MSQTDSKSNADGLAFGPTLAVKRVLVSGAAGQIGYSLIPLVCSGAVLGNKTAVDLVLLDVPQGMEALKGVVMEIEDGAYPLLRNVTTTTSVTEAFKGTDVAIMVGGFPRLPGMDRKDLLTKNADIFVAAGKALNDVGKKDCKVLVVANPANTNCFIMRDNAPNVPAENFTALTRLDHNRAVYQLATKVGVSSSDIGRVIVWGNHSNTMVPDYSHALVRTPQGVTTANSAVVTASGSEEAAKDWTANTFIPTVQNRGAAVIKARQKSSAMSAAQAISDHVRNWLSDDASERARQGDFVSMSVVSKGWYGVDAGLIFSFPCVVKTAGEVSVVEGLVLNDTTKQMLLASAAELKAERDMYLQLKAEGKFA